MNHVDSTTQWTWQQALDTRTEYLVDMADETISDAKMRSLKSVLKGSQLSNLLAVSLNTSSAAAIINWIRYQEGRKETQRAWGSGTGLGKEIVDNINAMKPVAVDVAQRVYNAPSSAEIQEIHLAMIRLYVGYMRRWFVARGGQ